MSFDLNELQGESFDLNEPQGESSELQRNQETVIKVVVQYNGDINYKVIVNNDEYNDTIVIDKIDKVDPV